MSTQFDDVFKQLDRWKAKRRTYGWKIEHTNDDLKFIHITLYDNDRGRVMKATSNSYDTVLLGLLISRMILEWEKN